MVQARSPRQRHHLARNVTARGEKVGAEQNEVDVPDTLDIAFRAWNIWLSVIVCLAKLQKAEKKRSGVGLAAAYPSTCEVEGE